LWRESPVTIDIVNKNAKKNTGGKVKPIELRFNSKE